MKGWKPAGLKRAMKEGGWTYAQLADALRERGWEYTHWAIRKWVEPGSPGPTHPVQAVALAEILECDYSDLART